MALTYKHTFGAINGTRVSFVEKGITKERMDFLKKLLEFNGFTVLTDEVAAKEEGAEPSFTIAVDDMKFNAIIWIYDRRLRLPDGRYVTHEFWDKGKGNTKPQYWESLYE
ncbi:MAG: hypothetical protein KAG64_06925 [Bacteroidales bacterium]|nr:hypothetical protein [Bacteroidales bacterium]